MKMFFKPEGIFLNFPAKRQIADSWDGSPRPASAGLDAVGRERRVGPVLGLEEHRAGGEHHE